jgi:hypothetical protein
MLRDILSYGIGTLVALRVANDAMNMKLYPYPEPKAKMKVA